MQTYHVRCAECGGDKWPTLPERPTRYVCVLCRMETAETLEARKRARAKGEATRRLKTGETLPGEAS